MERGHRIHRHTELESSTVDIKGEIDVGTTVPAIVTETGETRIFFRVRGGGEGGGMHVTLDQHWRKNSSSYVNRSDGGWWRRRLVRRRLVRRRRRRFFRPAGSEPEPDTRLSVHPTHASTLSLSLSQHHHAEQRKEEGVNPALISTELICRAFYVLTTVVHGKRRRN